VQAEQNRIRVEAANLRESEASRLRTLIRLTLAELRELSPSHFEDEMARMFERLGYLVQQTPYVNDRGRDAILQKDGDKFLLECKRYGKKVGSGAPTYRNFTQQ
jgi:HJR/Mrr/RecB family endonuclease